MIKCYDKKRILGAAHEVHLFSAMPGDVRNGTGIFGDAFVGDARVLGVQGLPGESMPAGQWMNYGSRALFELWSVRPDEGLLNAYLRTHPVIVDRLHPEKLEKMWLAADHKRERDTLKRFLQAWPTIRKSVADLPLVINNPGMAAQSC
ncbi:MAG: hypothetical protein U5R46_00445 [Gammaproteobacteria bacterium]|nr:hypothetical protein [Gammaproteobacteria bacterium]